ncbi:hypothetical protein GH714_016164 [Hevea brasiliensis]|uniref:NAC domain-containing protein n=1 Tax=Hevea brasiliensis TaxID=3981 RepID=A0A6A6LS16_HEVBR|nr:hypothetical protein GH714_016164 [Hevea brasiliensis]
MTWCNNNSVDERAIHLITASPKETTVIDPKIDEFRTLTCPSCGHNIELQDQAAGGIIHDLPGLPAGVKFDPTDQEILEHLEAMVLSDCENTDIELLLILRVSNDGQVRHFFHRPSKAYTTGTRKRRKVHTDEDGSETRWHKTGKTRPVFIGGIVKGYKKILVLYTNYGRQRKPEKTNWVMHQYHLGNNEEEKDGELVVSKVFYQTQPRQCGSSIKDSLDQNLKNRIGHDNTTISKNPALVDYYNPAFMSYDHGSHNRESPPQLIPNMVIQGDGSSFIRFAADTSKGKLQRDRDSDREQQ